MNKTKTLFTAAVIFFDFAVACAQPGSLDTSFDPGTGANGNVLSTAVQDDGKIIIGGEFTSYNGTPRNHIARLNPDGSLDSSFDPGTGANGKVLTISIQSDGNIIIGGEFTSFNGTSANHIARLNADGTLDNSFDHGTGTNHPVLTTSVQSDEKIIIGGWFSLYNGTTRGRIARLNPDGSLDTSFDPGTGAYNAIRTTSLQSDGKIIIGGGFWSYNEIPRHGIARLNTDGSLDTSFDPGAGANNGVLTTSIQSTGKIIIGGYFTSYDGTPVNRIARLNTDGSLDTSFNMGTGANNWVQTSAVQSDGKIIIGGWFIAYNGTPRNRIARLNQDGSLDTSFDPGTGAFLRVYSTAIQSDGKIIIGGEFTSYNGTPINRIARINGDTPVIIWENDPRQTVSVYPNPSKNHFFIETDLIGKVYTLTDTQGRVIAHGIIDNNLMQINMEDHPNGVYFIRMDTQVLKLVKQ